MMSDGTKKLLYSTSTTSSTVSQSTDTKSSAFPFDDGLKLKATTDWQSCLIMPEYIMSRSFRTLLCVTATRGYFLSFQRDLKNSYSMFETDYCKPTNNSQTHCSLLGMMMKSMATCFSVMASLFLSISSISELSQHRKLSFWLQDC